MKERSSHVFQQFERHRRVTPLVRALLGRRCLATPVAASPPPQQVVAEIRRHTNQPGQPGLVSSSRRVLPGAYESLLHDVVSVGCVAGEVIAERPEKALVGREDLSEHGFSKSVVHADLSYALHNIIILFRSGVSFRSACLYHASRPQKVTFEAEMFSVLTASPSDEKMRQGSAALSFLSCGPNILPARFKLKNIDETQLTVHAAISKRWLAPPIFLGPAESLLYDPRERSPHIETLPAVLPSGGVSLPSMCMRVHIACR